MMTVGTSLHGFTVTRVRTCAELSGEMMELIHEKSGARVCWMRNGEENKLFSVTFMTLPEDDTGVFHILEHSTLCGSEKYPVREPFVELLKGSMQTFLNAMTFPDRTMYPVSSRSSRDFLNLTGVYLDAVFAPRLLTDPNIFFQEGWHLDGTGDAPCFKGVVLNEMKGSMAQVGTIMDRGIMRLLFPDTCYGRNSGGDPAHIPDLTYERCVAAYRRYYHPSNASFYLDGDIPAEETFALMDSYLSRFEKRGDLPEIRYQVPRSAESTVLYEIGPEESPADREHLVIGRIFATWKDRVRCLAAQIVCELMTGTNASPLSRAVLDAGLAEDVGFHLSDGILQPCVTLSVHNIRDGKKEQLLAVIEQAVRDTMQNGFDRENVLAAINHMEFAAREQEEPAGLIRALNMANSDLYGGDPLMYLTYEEDLRRLRDFALSGGLETLLGEMLSEQGRCVLHVLPSHDCGAKARETENARLRSITGAWSEADRKANADMNAQLEAWQKTEDTPEQLASLPRLSLEDVGPMRPALPSVQICWDGVPVHFHPAHTRGIVYCTLYFRLTDLPLSMLPVAALLTKLLGELPTDRYDVRELQRAIRMYMGDMSVHTQTFSPVGDREQCAPYLVMHVSALAQNLEKALDVAAEMLLHTHFTEYALMEELVRQADEAARRASTGNGHVLAVSHLRSQLSSEGRVTDECGGIASIRWLHALRTAFSEKRDELATALQMLVRDSFVQERLLLSVTADHCPALTALPMHFPHGRENPRFARYPAEKKPDTAYCIPSQVCFAAAGGILGEGRAYHGSMAVAAHILSYTHLWNRVRVQGGAYGAGMSVRPSGVFFMHSFRDPTPERTRAVFLETAEALRSFCESDTPLTAFIIAALAARDPLLSPDEEGLIRDQMDLTGLTDAVRRQRRQEMLETDRAQLSAFADQLATALRNPLQCVVGHASALEALQGMRVENL